MEYILLINTLKNHKHKQAKWFGAVKALICINWWPLPIITTWNISSLTPIRAGLFIYRIHCVPRVICLAFIYLNVNGLHASSLIIHHYVCLCLFTLVMYNEVRCLNEAVSASHLHTSIPSKPLRMSLIHIHRW